MKNWICIFTNDGNSYTFDSSKWDVSKRELSLCIQSQLYGEIFEK